MTSAVGELLDLSSFARDLARDPVRVLLVDSAEPDPPLAEATLTRRPRPGDAVRFRVERAGRGELVLEVHGAWHLNVDRPRFLEQGDEVEIRVR